jgi:hypothetical protein
VAARVCWATKNELLAAIVTEALDPEGRLSVSMNMEEDLHEGDSSSLLPGMSTARKYTTEYFFKLFYFTAPEVSWDEFCGSARAQALIMKYIGAPAGSYLSVVKVLRDNLEAEEAEVAYGSSAGIKTGRAEAAKRRAGRPIG